MSIIDSGKSLNRREVEFVIRKLNWIILLLIFTISLTSFAVAKDLTLTIVYDNNPCNEELETRWGFSCLVEGLEKTILFDVGGVQYFSGT